MTSVRDPFDVLTTHRPDEPTLQADWPSPRRAELLARVLDAATTPTTANGPTRAWAGTGVGATKPREPSLWRRPLPRLAAAVALAAAIGGYTLISPGTPRVAPAAGLDTLSAIARSAAAQPIPAGQFAHLLTQSHQSGQATSLAPTADPDKVGALPQGRVSQTRESWISADGIMWVRDSSSAGPAVERWKFCLPQGDIAQPSPAAIDQWPTDAAGLEALLRSQVSGSTSQDEAVFVAIGDVLRLGYTPPAIRAAAIEVLGGLPQVTTATRTVNGVALLDVSFRDEVARPGVTATLIFDSTTSELMAESLAGGGADYAAEYSQRSLVPSVPAEVTAAAVDQCDQSDSNPATAVPSKG